MPTVQESIDRAAAVPGMIGRQIKGDLRRFKAYVERLGGESGAWRGRITPS